MAVQLKKEEDVREEYKYVLMFLCLKKEYVSMLLCLLNMFVCQTKELKKNYESK